MPIPTTNSFKLLVLPSRLLASSFFGIPPVSLMSSSGVSCPPNPPHATKPSSADELRIIETYLRNNQLPETLEAFLEETQTSFRRSSGGDNPSWTCIICDKVFTKKGSAKRHCDTAHLEETAAERVECPQCLQKFNRRDDLYSHIRRIHRDSGGENLVQSLIHNTNRRPSKRVKTATATAAAVVVETIPAPPAQESPSLYSISQQDEEEPITPTSETATPVPTADYDNEWEHDYLVVLELEKGRFEEQDTWAEESLTDGAIDAFAQSDSHFESAPALMFVG